MDCLLTLQIRVSDLPAGGFCMASNEMSIHTVLFPLSFEVLYSHRSTCTYTHPQHTCHSNTFSSPTLAHTNSDSSLTLTHKFRMINLPNMYSYTCTYTHTHHTHIHIFIHVQVAPHPQCFAGLSLPVTCDFSEGDIQTCLEEVPGLLCTRSKKISLTYKFHVVLFLQNLGLKQCKVSVE